MLLRLGGQRLADGDAAVVSAGRQDENTPSSAAGAAMERSDVRQRSVERGQWWEAADCYQRALELDPGHAPALVNLGTCRERLGDPAAARKLYARAGVADPGLPEALNAPRARVIWCRRDPLDTCLSCYVQSFAEGQAFACDLGALGLVFRLQERLMRHWRAVLPNPIMEVRYEDVVADPQAEVPRLIAFAGLDWQPGCLDFTANRRPIRTSSLWQLREPVHRRSVGRWRHYTRHLEPTCR